MKTPPYLSIVIPAYNEADTLPTTLVLLDQYLSTVDYPYEILVVNDGSKDATAEIVRKMSETIKNLRLVDNSVNHGKGACVRQGMLMAEGMIRLFDDADNSTSIDHFETMRPFFDAGYQVVIGSRGLKESVLDPPQPFLKHLLGRAGNLLIQLVNLPGIHDSQCGFKAFTAEAAEKVFRLQRIERFSFDIEILALARSLGYRIKEIPVRWVNNLTSTVTPADYLKVFVENFKIRSWFIADVYGLRKLKKDSAIARQ